MATSRITIDYDNEDEGCENLLDDLVENFDNAGISTTLRETSTPEQLNASAVAATTAAIACGFFDPGQSIKAADIPAIPYESNEGGIGVFALLAGYAEEIERLWMRHDTEQEGAPGVWDYEVSEPFGVWLRMNSMPDRDDALAELARLDAAFWAQ